jgi:hypothetical protein
MQVGIHLLQLRPGEIRQLGNDLLCAHVDILSEKPNMEKQKLGKQKVEITANQMLKCWAFCFPNFCFS